MKTLFITGANGDIGNNICNFFKEKGWFIIGTDIHDDSKNNKYIDEYYCCNLFFNNNIKALMKKLIDNNREINCIIHCAGYQVCKPVWEYTEEEWINSFNCNIHALFLIVKYGIEIIKKFDLNIINIGSIHSICTSKNIASYSTSKAALVSLTKNLAIDLSSFNVRVNCISPGAIDTKMLRQHLSDEQIEKMKEKHLIKNIGKVNQVSETCWFICNNKFMNGSNVIIDGGITTLLASE